MSPFGRSKRIESSMSRHFKILSCTLSRPPLLSEMIKFDRSNRFHSTSSSRIAYPNEQSPQLAQVEPAEDGWLNGRVQLSPGARLAGLLRQSRRAGVELGMPNGLLQDDKKSPFDTARAPQAKPWSEDVFKQSNANISLRSNKAWAPLPCSAQSQNTEEKTDSESNEDCAQSDVQRLKHTLYGGTGERALSSDEATRIGEKFIERQENGENFKASIHQFEQLIEACCRCGSMESARRLELVMLQRGYKRTEKTCRTIIMGYSKAELFKDMFDYLAKAEKETSTVLSEHCFIIALRGLTLAKHTMKAERILDRWRSKGKLISQAADTLLIRGYTSEALPMEARRVFSKVIASGQVPQPDFSNALLVSLFKDSDIELAREFFKYLLKNDAPMSAKILTTMISGFCQKFLPIALDKLEEVIQYFDKGNDLWLQTSLITRSGILRDIAGALERFQQARFGKLRLDAVAYTAMIVALMHHEEHAASQILFEQMIQSGVQPDIKCLDLILLHYCKNDQISLAEDLFYSRTVNHPKVSATSFALLIYTYAKDCDVDKAENVFQSMSRKGISPEIRCYGGLIYAYTEAGLLGHANTLLSYALQNFGKQCGPPVFVPLLNAYAKVGNWKGYHKIQELQQKCHTSTSDPEDEKWFRRLEPELKDVRDY